MRGQVIFSRIRNQTFLIIQASTDYQAVQTQSLPQGRSDVQSAPGHAHHALSPPGRGGRAEVVTRGGRFDPQGTRGQGPQQSCLLGFYFKCVKFIFLTVGSVSTEH